MSGEARRRAAFAAGVVLTLAATIGLQLVRDRTYPQFMPLEALLDIPSGEVLDRLALSFDAVVADVYWIRTLQHFGGTRRAKAGPKRYELLYPLLDITTTLDPKFAIAYRFGALFLSEPPPGGPGRADQAVTLLEKGLRTSPERWQYLQDIGFVYYWAEHDYTRAAAYFERAAGVRGAPWFLRSLAATTLASGGDRRSSRTLWTSILQTTADEWIRGDAARRLMQLDALDQIDELTAIVERFRRSGGAQPYSLQAIVRAGLLRGVPVDPTGVPYYVGAYGGKVDLGDTSTLGPLPQAGR